MAKVIKAGILGGVIIFIWSAISWMVLPWHMETMHSFKDGTAVAQVIAANAEKSGIYMLPTMHKDGSAMTADELKGPSVFASVKLTGMSPSMTVPMMIGLFTDIVVACLGALLLMQAVNLSYWGRVGFLIIFALGLGIVGTVPYGNWFCLDVCFLEVIFADIVISWFFAALVMAKICRR